MFFFYFRTERKSFLVKKSDASQLVIDAGQKNFGACFCKTCGFLYDCGDPEEEESHTKFHDSIPPSLKYPVRYRKLCQVCVAFYYINGTESIYVFLLINITLLFK